MEGRRLKDGEELPYPIRDEGEILSRFADLWAAPDLSPGAALPVAPPALRKLVRGALFCREFWGEDLGAYPAIAEEVGAALETILRDGMAAALARAAGGPESAATEALPGVPR
jgi:hypothetical protein